MDIRQRLKREITQSNLSLSEISRRCALNQATVWRFMNEADREITISVVAALSEFFGLELRSRKRSTQLTGNVSDPNPDS